MPQSDYLSGDCHDDSHQTCLGHKRGQSHIPCNCECHDEKECFACHRKNEPGEVILLESTNGPVCLVCLKEMLALPLETLKAPTAASGGKKA